MRTTAFLSFMCAAVAACISTQPVESEARACIDHLIEASNQRDLEAAVDSYCPDAVLHPPQGTDVIGRAAIRARYATMYANWQPALTVEHSTTSIEGEHATDTGFTYGRLKPVTSGDDRIVEDAYEAVLHREDGVWRVHELSWRPRAP